MTTRRRTLRVSPPRPLWRDPRLLGGLALIALSILACTWLVSQARAGVSVYRTTRPVAVGEVLDASSVALVAARVDPGPYVLEGDLPEGTIASRSLGEGELLPKSSTTTGRDRASRRLVVSVADGLPASAKPGDLLELWAVPANRYGAEEKRGSRLVAGGATLVRVLDEDSSLTRAGSRIEILVDEGVLAPVLDAMSGTDALAAIPVGAA